MIARRIGLFGGSFDPPHIGHVALLEAALQVLSLDAALVVPAGLPVHRRLSDCATPVQRFDWMQRIFAGQGRVQVVDWEVVESKPIPTIVTLRRFAGEFPGARAILLLGADAFAGMDGWVDYPDYAGLCDVAVFGRVACSTGDAGSAFESLSLDAWLQQPAACGRRVNIDVPLPDVSATEIRRLAVRKESLAGRVPECVRRDIERAYAVAAA